MVNIEYAKLFNSLTSLFKPSTKLEGLNKRYVMSMARLGHLQDLKIDVPNPFYQGKEEVGHVYVPKDFFSLKSVEGLGVDVFYFGDAPSKGVDRDTSFHLRLYCDEVPLIDVLYGSVSGVQEILVHGFGSKVFNCKVPTGYSLAQFADVLNKGQLKDFVFQYAKLTKDDIQRINKWGLC